MREGGRGRGGKVAEGVRKELRHEQIGREGKFKGGTLRRTLASIQYTAHKTTHNAAIATLVLQIQHCKRVPIQTL